MLCRVSTFQHNCIRPMSQDTPDNGSFGPPVNPSPTDVRRPMLTRFDENVQCDHVISSTDHQPNIAARSPFPVRPDEVSKAGDVLDRALTKSRGTEIATSRVKLQVALAGNLLVRRIVI